jgi:hypothetical protein
MTNRRGALADVVSHALLDGIGHDQVAVAAMLSLAVCAAPCDAGRRRARLCGRGRIADHERHGAIADGTVAPRRGRMQRTAAPTG